MQLSPCVGNKKKMLAAARFIRSHSMCITVPPTDIKHFPSCETKKYASCILCDYCPIFFFFFQIVAGTLVRPKLK